MTPAIRKANVAVERLALEFSRAAATGNLGQIGNAALDLAEACDAVVTEVSRAVALNHLTYDHGKAVPFGVADEGIRQ